MNTTAAPTALQFLVDALNVAYWGGRPPSLRLPLALMAALRSERHAVQLYFDASARYQLNDEADVYEQLIQHPECAIEVPSGRRADGELLKHARASGAAIISRDHFSDYRRRYRKLIDDRVRLLTGHIQQGVLCVPALALRAILPATTEAAWLHACSLIGTPLEAAKP